MIVDLNVENISRISPYAPNPKISAFPFDRSHTLLGAASAPVGLFGAKGRTFYKSGPSPLAFDPASLAQKMTKIQYDIEANKKSMPLKDSGFNDLKQQMGKLSDLKDNLSVNNLGQTLARVNALNSSRMEKRLQMEQVANAYQSVRDTLINTYTIGLSLQAQSASPPNILDTYL